MSDPPPARPPRLASLDQFRGYTVLAMLAVNFLGSRAAVPPVFSHHNTYCSYADTIMPQFFLAVGFAMRLTFPRRTERDGAVAAYTHLILRALGLILLGIVFYGLDGNAKSWSDLERLGPLGTLTQAFQREPFQALVHIGLAVLWITPVIAAHWRIRLAFAAGSALLFVALSKGFYFDFAWNRPVIDGGPLGFLSWSIPTLVGTLACDLIKARGAARAVIPLLLFAAALMLGGQALTALNPSGLAPPPFVPPPSDQVVEFWTMSQRTGSVSYQLFGAGFSLAVLALFVAVCDGLGWSLAPFRTFGTNALAAYLLHGIVGGAIAPYVPADSPAWYLLTALGLYLFICWLFIRALERRGLLIRL